MKTILGNKFHTMEQTAVLLECSIKTVSRRIADGLLIAKIFGGKKYILEQSILDYLTKRTEDVQRT